EADLHRPAGAGHGGHGHRRTGGGDPSAFGRVRGSGRRGGRRIDGRPGPRPGCAGEVRRRLARRDPPQRRGLPGGRGRATAPAVNPRVVLVGAPGAGKSTIGKRLATAWDVPFCDTDAEIEELTGRTIPDIFATDGERAFRAIEEDVVAAALDSAPGVVSLGGGAVLSARTRAALAGHTV